MYDLAGFALTASFLSLRFRRNNISASRTMLTKLVTPRWQILPLRTKFRKKIIRVFSHENSRMWESDASECRQIANTGIDVHDGCTSTADIEF